MNSSDKSQGYFKDWCLAPSLGTLAGAAGAACLGPRLQPDPRGTSRTPWPLQQCRVQVPETLGRSRSQGGLGNRHPRGVLCTAEQGAARVSPTRTRSASTIATWTSSGSTLLNGPCPMDCPTTEEASGARGPRGRSRRAHSRPSGRCAALVCGVGTAPACTSVPAPWPSAGTQGQQKILTKRNSQPAVPMEACVRGG